MSEISFPVLLIFKLLIVKCKWTLNSFSKSNNSSSSVVFIGFLNSIHFERYVIDVAKNVPKRFFILGGSNYTIPTKRLLNKINEPKSNITFIPRWRFFVDYFVQNYGTYLLVRVVRKLLQRFMDKDLHLRGEIKYTYDLITQLRPKIVHFFEMQHAGYLLDDSGILIKKDFLLYYTNYGSDIKWFINFDAHKVKMRHILSIVDVVFCESSNDQNLVRQLGYNNVFAQIRLNSVINREYVESFQIEKDHTKRKIIAIKSYNEFMGRANIVLSSLFNIRNDIQDYELVFYSCSNDFAIQIDDLLHLTNLRYKIFINTQISNRDLLNIFCKSILSLSTSISDGVGTSNIESALCGAYVITSNNSSIHEYLENDCFTSNIDWYDVAAFSNEILRVLKSPSVLSSKSIKNREKIKRILFTHNRNYELY